MAANGPHSFPLAGVFDYLHPDSVRKVLTQAVLDQPMFESRWRWNAMRSLMLDRFQNGKPVPPQIQRMRATDLLAATFPAAIACPENMPAGDLPIPMEHPLVRQTIEDCLTEAMDIDGLIGVLKRIENAEIECIARDLPEPSPLAHEILNAKPYAFLDNAPLEERRTQAVCFITGHGEHYAPGHVHYSHVETLGGDQPGRSDVIEAPPDGLDRLKLALETIGYSDRAIEPATLPAIPEACAAVVDIGATSAYAPAEVEALRNYLSHGGRALLAYDPRFPVAPELASLLGSVGLAIEDGVVVDPTNHYGTDQEEAAVPYYPPHPITEEVALTVFPGARPIRLRGPVAGVTAAELIATSKDSYVRPLDASVHTEHEAGPRLLAAAMEGTWPAPDGAAFRLVLVGNSSFAANAFFPYASNGDLAVSMIRWLADDTATPLLKPEAYSLPEMRLTHRQMQVTFLLVEVLLPLSVMALGVFVWWRRR